MKSKSTKILYMICMVLMIILIKAVTCSSVHISVSLEDNVGKIEWVDCRKWRIIIRDAECGYLPVPLDYANPTREKIQIAFARRKHEVSDEDFQGIMLSNSVGPGSPSIGLIALRDKFFAQVRDLYDWIGFDPRGVGRSQPALYCDPEYPDGPAPNYIPSTQQLEKTWLRRSKDYAMACAQNNSKLLRHLNTINVAYDMESIRIALGEEKINFYGFSYGTYLGQVYATLFPNRVRRMVLDGIVDPRNIWFKLVLSQAPGFDRNMNIWFRWLAKYDDKYKLGKTEDEVRKRWDQVMKELETKPINGTIGQFEWLNIFLDAAYAKTSWNFLGVAFDIWVNEGDASILLAYHGMMDKNEKVSSRSIFLSAMCTDAKWPQGWGSVRKENWNIFQKAPISAWYNAWYYGPCQYWSQKGGKPVNVDGRKVGDILLFSESLDAATPFEGSLEVRRRFPRARLLAVPGGISHCESFDKNGCVHGFISRYLVSGELPERKVDDGPDAVCPPFGDPDP